MALTTNLRLRLLSLAVGAAIALAGATGLRALETPVIAQRRNKILTPIVGPPPITTAKAAPTLDAAPTNPHRRRTHPALAGSFLGGFRTPKTTTSQPADKLRPDGIAGLWSDGAGDGVGRAGIDHRREGGRRHKSRHLRSKSKCQNRKISFCAAPLLIDVVQAIRLARRAPAVLDFREAERDAKRHTRQA
jgi:hypothetical protein